MFWKKKETRAKMGVVGLAKRWGLESIDAARAITRLHDFPGEVGVYQLTGQFRYYAGNEPGIYYVDSIERWERRQAFLAALPALSAKASPLAQKQQCPSCFYTWDDWGVRARSKKK